MGYSAVLLLAFASASFGGTFVALRPATFVRSTGKPVAVTVSFTVLNPNTAYTLHIDNGGMHGEFARVSSAVILLNGVQVVGPSNFNQNVTVIEKPLTLVRTNTVSVELRSQPGSGITLQVIGTDNDFPTITATTNPSPNAAGWNQGPVTVSFSCADSTSEIATCSAPSTVATEGANQTITGTAIDRAGNQATRSVTLNIDTTPPGLSSSLNPAPNSSGWHNTNVTVSFDATDSLSGVAVVTAPITVTAEGANQGVNGTATDRAGNSSTMNTTVNLDKTPPSVGITSPSNGSALPTPEITVTGTVSDVLSGVASVTCHGRAASVSGSTFVCALFLSEGANALVVQATDTAGNVGTANPQVTLDTRPLVVALTDATGNPVPHKPVIVKVTQNDGMVAAGGPPAPAVIATTNAQGQAQVQWTLGARAGAGENAVEAYAVGVGGTALFMATGTPGPAGNIVVDTGNAQIGVVTQALPRPLLAVVVDNGNNRLAGVPVTFTVIRGGGNFAGQPSVTVTTDSDGRAAATLTLGPQAGNAKNLVEATFPSYQGFPAAFTASGRVSGDPTQTIISGVVLDNSNVPIPGVTIRAVLTNILHSNVSALQTVAAVQTDAHGQFSIPQAPVGFVKLLVDGSTVQLPGQYPALEYDLVTVAGQNNTVGMPIYLLPLNTNNQLCVTATTGGGTLTIPDAPGFSLTFGPGQVTFPGGSKTGCVSVTVVHSDKVPMVPGFGQQPRFIVTIQPAGAVFNPPAPITLPNVDGLKPRAVTEMYSFDHDIGSFVAIGTGVVNEDGQVIRSSPGVGVLKAGWHCGGDPSKIGTVADCPPCQICHGNGCVPVTEQDGTVPASVGPPMNYLPIISAGVPILWGLTLVDAPAIDISVYCGAGVWQARVTQADIQIRQSVRLLPGVTPVIEALVAETSSCATLATMKTSLNTIANQGIDVYYMLN